MDEMKLNKSHYYSEPVSLFDESGGKPEKVETVQILRECKVYAYTDYEGQDIYDDLNLELMESLKENFDNNVRGIKINFNYYHEMWGVAAGWIKDLKIRQDDGAAALWATVEWTPKAQKMIEDKEVGYCSVEIENYMDRETKKVYGPTLVGVGLTNRPQIKKMASLTQLSEQHKIKSTVIKKGDSKMTDKEKLEKMEKEKAEMEKNLMEMKKKMENDKKKMDEIEAKSDKTERESITGRLFSEGKMTKAQVDSALGISSREAFDELVKFCESNVASIKTDQIGGNANTSPSGNFSEPSQNGRGQSSQSISDKAYAYISSHPAEFEDTLELSEKFKKAVGKVLKSEPDLAKKHYSESINIGHPADMGLGHYTQHQN